MIVGHEAVREELERELPPVTLLIGPKSVGKTTLARHAAAHHSSFTVYHGRLSAGIARQVVEGAPVRHRQLSIYIIDLDNSTEAAQNILLKLLEEPPPHCRFILVASRVPLLTVLSRARTYRLGLLTDAQVAQVLEQNGQGHGLAVAQAAARARGQVSPATEAVGDQEASRITSVVAAAVRAATDGGGLAVDMALRNWTQEHTRVLELWATERASGRWVYFTEDFAPKATRNGAMRLLYVLGSYEVMLPETDTRPAEMGHARTAPAVALSALKEKK